MIYKLLFTLPFILLSYFNEPVTIEQDSVCGNWITESKDSVVKIFKKENKYFGKIIWLRDPLDKNGKPIKDTKNPNENLRSREIKGLVFLHDFVYDCNDKKWCDGNIYDPKSGSIYDASITLKSEDVLILRGYIGLPAFGRTVTWQRYKK